MKTPRIACLIVGVLLLFAVGCVTTQAPIQQAKPQEVLIKIQGVDTVKVEEEQTEEQRVNETRSLPYLGADLQFGFIADGKGFFPFYSSLMMMDLRSFWNDLCVFGQHGVKDIRLLLCSPGGDAFAGMGLADMIEQGRKMGFYFTVDAPGIVASAAVPIFAVCDMRIAHKGTLFMVHESAIWKWPGRETHSDIKAQGRLMDMLETNYLAKMAAYSNLSVDEWREKERQTTWFTAEQAKDYGLVDKIE